MKYTRGCEKLKTYDNTLRLKNVPNCTHLMDPPHDVDLLADGEGEVQRRRALLARQRVQGAT